MELAHTDVLAVIAEVAAAFVGFSLAIGLLQPDQPGAKLRRQAMHSVAELAMVSGAGALVVLVIKTYGLPAEMTWRIGSAFAALLWGATFYLAVKRYADVGYSVTDKNVRYAVLSSVTGVVLLSVNSIFPTAGVGPIHISGLFLALITAGYLFLLSTFIIESDKNTR